MAFDDDNLLKTDRLNASYEKKQILFDISLQIPSGERTLFIGPNGAGKSTLLKTLTGLVFPDSGVITFQGKDITKVAPNKRIMPSGMAYLIQNNNIIPSLNVLENLSLGGYPQSVKEINTHIKTILEIFPFLRNKLDIRSGYLSGGERQALAIGMVLIKKPRLLLLDEPTAGLSPKSAARIMECISDLGRFTEIESVCIVEHRLKECLPWASKLVIMANGRIAHVSENPGEFISCPQKLETFYF